MRRPNCAGPGRSQFPLVPSPASEWMAERQRSITRKNNSAAAGNVYVSSLRSITGHRRREAAA
jgi:hypothetical protein